MKRLLRRSMLRERGVLRLCDFGVRWEGGYGRALMIWEFACEVFDV